MGKGWWKEAKGITEKKAGRAESPFLPPSKHAALKTAANKRCMRVCVWERESRRGKRRGGFAGVIIAARRVGMRGSRGKKL